jgi:hypothetical protein
MKNSESKEPRRFHRYILRLRFSITEPRFEHCTFLLRETPLKLERFLGNDRQWCMK